MLKIGIFLEKDLSLMREGYAIMGKYLMQEKKISLFVVWDRVDSRLEHGLEEDSTKATYIILEWWSGSIKTVHQHQLWISTS